MSKIATMKLVDSGDEDESFEITLGKQFRKYVRMKDMSPVKLFNISAKKNEFMCGHYMCKNKHARITIRDSNNNEILDETESESESECETSFNGTILINDNRMDVSDSGSLDDIDKVLRKELGEPFQWYSSWNDIVISLESMKLNNENHLHLEYFTYFLNLHILNGLELDVRCYRAVLYCIDPKLIKNLFDMNLINIEDSDHIGCWMKDDLFSGIELSVDDINLINKHASKLLNSLAVLIYKVKVHHKDEMVILLQEQLSVFVNREEKDTSRKDSISNAFLIKAVKNLLNAFILNGYYTKKESLKSFLININSELEDFTTASSEMDSDDMDDEEVFNIIHQHHMHLHHHLPQPVPPNQVPQLAANQITSQKTTADRLNINVTDLIKSVFPLSLQEMCRIVIKKNLNPYNITGVNKLSTMLPNEMKKFLLFQNEIDAIIG